MTFLFIKQPFFQNSDLLSFIKIKILIVHFKMFYFFTSSKIYFLINFVIDEYLVQTIIMLINRVYLKIKIKFDYKIHNQPTIKMFNIICK